MLRLMSIEISSYFTFCGQLTGLSLTLVYSSTNMSKSVWTSGFWKPLVHKNMSNFWNNIFCERGFTHMKLVKSQQRSSLKEDSV